LSPDFRFALTCYCVIFRTSAVNGKPSYDNARYYAIQITASLFLDKPRDASANVARSCDCEFPARLYHAIISETLKSPN